MKTDQTYEEYRPLLFSIAYRMVGSVGEAEDIVQEAFLRLHRAASQGEEIESPKAYLSTVATRLAIDYLRSARANREQYIGTWFPEPLLTEQVEDVAEHAEMADTLSIAFLLLLETLSPVERAVFVLRDVFGYGFDEIAEIVGKREDNVRQLAVRARKHVEARRPRFEASREKRDELARTFLSAIEDGDLQGLIGILAEDVVAAADGGGKAAALPRPLQGREQVARFMLGLARLAQRQGMTLRPAETNGQPGALAFDREGNPVSALVLEIVDGVVTAVRAVVNPDKLRHIPRPDLRGRP